MLPRQSVFFTRADDAEDELPRLTFLRRRRAPIYPIGRQAHTRSRVFFYRTAPWAPETSDEECRFVVMHRRQKPMAHVAASSLWNSNPSVSTSYTANSATSTTWTANSPTSTTWTSN